MAEQGEHAARAHVEPIVGQAMKMSTTAAERMRLYRKRRRQGLRYVRIALHVTEIDDLIRMGLLKIDRRQDPEAVQAAVTGLVYRALEEAT